MTPQEKSLWFLLRDRRLTGFKFRRQVPIGPYVADFACFEAKLVVELDGSQHAESARDARRDAALRRRGFDVLRIWNNELRLNRDGVLEAIYSGLVRTSPSPGLRPPSPTRGEGPTERAMPLASAVGIPSPPVGEGAERSEADEGDWS